jgi:hypothetical protein
MASVVLAFAVFAAQTAMATTILNIPFAFTVGNQTFPSGHYAVVRDNNGNAVKLVGATGSFVWGIRPGDSAPSNNRVVLKFDNLGSMHTLRAIQYGSMTTSQLDKRELSRRAHSEIVLGK